MPYVINGSFFHKWLNLMSTVEWLRLIDHCFIFKVSALRRHLKTRSIKWSLFCYVRAFKNISWEKRREITFFNVKHCSGVPPHAAALWRGLPRPSQLCSEAALRRRFRQSWRERSAWALLTEGSTQKPDIDPASEGTSVNAWGDVLWRINW